jgi:peptidoglycan/xylan/chitin deacetylase (PgdA/CDA1 family)
MIYLSKNFQLLPLQKLTQLIREGKTLPKAAAAVTLDDGYRDNYVNAYPILKRHHVPATLFLITGHIGTDDLFWWDKIRYAVHQTQANKLQLDEFGEFDLSSPKARRETASGAEQMASNLVEDKKNLFIDKLVHAANITIPTELGTELNLSWDEVARMNEDDIDFGAHTVSHPNLTRVPLDQARNEVTQSKKDIEKGSGKPCNLFAYPLGALNDSVDDIIRQSGFIGAVTSNPTWITPKIDPYRLGRLGVTEKFCEFRIVISGLWKPNRKISIPRILPTRY